MVEAPAVPRAQSSELRDFGAFLLVGGIGAACFVALSAALIELRTGVPAWVMSALCWAVMIGPVYLAHRTISFRSDAPHMQALPRYVLVQVVGLSLAAVFSFLAYNILGFSSVLGAITVAGLTAAVNFFVLRLWAFAAG